MTADTSEVDREQLEYWNGEAGARWVSAQGQIDELLRSITEAALERAAVTAGTDVVEIGCGCGSTTVELAARAGATGSVLGVDLSAPMLAQARARLAAAKARVALALADAARYAFAPASADLVFSRFGVMFFGDPAAAFANLRTVLRPSGRLVFVCWQAVDQNPWVTVPLAAALEHLPRPEPPAPGAPGPFSLADPDRLRHVLTRAGFRDLALEDLRRPLRVAGSADDVMGFYEEIGPLARVLRDAAAGARPRAVAAIRSALGRHHDGGGVTLGSASWLVTAAV
jgi:SAM-dependent methyltransferase